MAKAKEENKQGKSLTKGGDISLTKETPGLVRVRVGLGWDTPDEEHVEYDLDACAFMLNTAGKVRFDDDFIFYNNIKSPEESVEHIGDNRTGEGDGDDEIIKVKLDEVPLDIEKIVFSVTIHEAEDRFQNFGMISNAYMRIINDEGGQELARYDIGKGGEKATGVVFGELFRTADEWKFRAIGNMIAGGLFEIAQGYGVNV